MNVKTALQTGRFAATARRAKILKSMVGVAGFEPTTLCSQSMDTMLFYHRFSANGDQIHRPRVK